MNELLLWGVYFPLIKLLHGIFFWVPELVERRRFEKKNHTDPGCTPFSDVGLVADFCFEFSSEGEYQQVASLISDGLHLGKRFELVFFSPSVEKAVVELGAKYPQQIRYLRYPLLTISPWHSFSNWVTSQRLILVRYDFFPEFLLWARADRTLHLLWVTFKKLRLKKKSPGLYKRLFLTRARSIFYASPEDKEVGERLGFSGEFYDFRLEQIRRRISGREEKFTSAFSGYGELRARLEAYPRHRRILIGNAWPSDLPVLKGIPEDFFILVVPHKLEGAILRAFDEGLSEFRDDVEVTTGESFSKSRTQILNKKGVLCELYADFDFAYVGGGFEGSIHSVHEPLVAGVPCIACGPQHHRSTEYDLALDLGRVTEVNSAGDLLALLQRGVRADESVALTTILSDYEKRKKEVFEC